MEMMYSTNSMDDNWQENQSHRSDCRRPTLSGASHGKRKTLKSVELTSYCSRNVEMKKSRWPEAETRCLGRGLTTYAILRPVGGMMGWRGGFALLRCETARVDDYRDQTLKIVVRGEMDYDLAFRRVVYLGGSRYQLWRAEIEVIEERRNLLTSREYEDRQGFLAKSEAHCRALEARVTVLETKAHLHEWQRQATDDLAVQHIMRTQALEAGARVDTLGTW
ncbi:hypothetical protein Tco_0486691 [Tanacetum coccineum]